MGYIETTFNGGVARVHLTSKDNAHYIEERFRLLPWVETAAVHNLMLTIRTMPEEIKGSKSLIGRIGYYLPRFRRAAEAVNTASDDDNGWKDIIRYRPKETNEELIGHVGATPTTTDEPEPIATTTDRPASPLAEIIREVGYSLGRVKVTVVGLYVSADGGYDMTEVSVESLPA